MAPAPAPILVRSTSGIVAWVDLDSGKVWPVVSGADENEPGGQGGQPVELTPEQQAHVDGLIAQRVAAATTEAEQRGRTAGAEVREAEIATWLSAQADEAGGQRTEEAERLRNEREQARTQAANEANARQEAEAARDTVTLDAFAMISLLGAGMPHSAIPDGLRLLGHQLGDDEAALAGRADALKGRLPALFVTTDGQPAGGAPPPPPAGGGPRPQPPGGQSAADRAKARHDRIQATRPALRPSAA